MIAILIGLIVALGVTSIFLYGHYKFVESENDYLREVVKEYRDIAHRYQEELFRFKHRG